MAVSGSVHVKNVGSAATQNLMIIDEVQCDVGSGYKKIAEIAVDTSKKPVLAAGEEFSYPFTVYFKHVEGATYQNIERVSISNLVDRTGQSMAAEAVMSVKATSAPLQADGQDASATITDVWTTPDGFSSSPSTIGPWTISESKVLQYDVKVTNSGANYELNVSMTNNAILTESDTKVTHSASSTVWLSTDFTPGLMVMKKAPACVKMGDPIVYNFTVTNFGDIKLVDVIVTDPLFPDAFKIGELGPGKSVMFDSPQYMTSASTPNPLVNTAKVTGYYGCNPIVNYSSATVSVVDAKMTFVKGGPDCVNTYGSITWTYSITNTGKVTLNNLYFYDEYLKVEKTQGSLVPGGVWSFELVSQAGGEVTDIKNSAYVTAKAECGIELNMSSSHTVKVTQASISLVKDGPAEVDSGMKFLWTFNITNTGQTALTDVMFSDANLSITNRPIKNLAVGESFEFTEEDTAPTVAGKFYNDAVVTAKSACGQNVIAVSDDASKVIIIRLVSPEISISKVGPTCAKVGTNVEWTITITNTGSADLTNVVFKDPALGMAPMVRPSLVVGAVWTFNVSGKLPMTPGEFTNTGIVTADSLQGPIGPVESSFITNVIDPKIDIEKSAPAEVEPGATITWKFWVKNTGSVELSNVVVTDTDVGKVWTYEGTLAKGAVWEFTWDTIAPSSGEVVNDVTVNADSSCNLKVSDSDTAIVNVKLPCDCLEVWKTVDKSTVIPGDKVTYTYTIYNCNWPENTPAITNFVIRDRMVSDKGCVIASFDVESGDWVRGVDGKKVMVPWGLAPGDKFVFTYQLTIPDTWTYCDCGEWLNNTVYVDACCCGKFIQNQASASVHVFDYCSVDIQKVANKEIAKPGDFIDYTITVRNTGMNKLCSIKVWEKCLTDEPIVLCDKKCDLNPCDSMEFKFTYQVPWDWTCCVDGSNCPEQDGHWLTNEAGVCAFCPKCNKEVTDSDKEDVYIDVPPGLLVTKTAYDKKNGKEISQITYDPVNGNDIWYKVVVKNVGCVPITCIVVNDDMLWCEDKTICCLKSCDSVTYWEEYDLDDWSWCENGDYLNNTVTASGWACDMPVKASASESVKVIDKYHLEVEKIGPEVAYEGQTITYQIIVRNLGSEMLPIVVVEDELLKWKQEISCLNPCDSRSFDVTYPIPATDCNDCDKVYELAECGCCRNDWWTLKNEVYATAWGVGGILAKASDCERVKVMNPCNVEIVVRGPENAVPGQTITFSVGVINAGNKTLLELEPTVWIGCKEFCLGKICYLDPGQENWTTITYIVPDCVCGQCPNAGASVPCAECAESLSESGGQCMNPCHAYKLEYKASVRAECCCNDIMIGDCTKGHVDIQGCCGVKVTKTTDQKEVVPGEKITWTITVTNTGVKDICWLVVEDKLTGFYQEVEYLGSGESLSWETNYTVPMDWYWCDHKDRPYIVNEVNVKAWCCFCEKWLEDCDKDKVDVKDCDSLIITKEYMSTIPETSSVDGNSDCVPNLNPKPGDTVWYKITVENKGSCPISCIKISDPTIGYYNTICCLCPSCTKEGKVIWTDTVSYVIPKDWTYCEDGEYLDNKITASGFACGKPVTATDTERIMVNVDHIIQVFKKGPSEASPGQEITYEISVHNAGKQAVCNVKVVDYLSHGAAVPVFQELMDRRCPLDTEIIGCLEPCEWYNYTVTYTVPADWTCMDGFWLYNDAKVTADACCPCEKLFDESMVSTRIVDIACAVEVEKCGPRSAEPGDTVQYKIYVTNPNCKAISCVRVVDETLGLDYVIPWIEPFMTVMVPLELTDYKVSDDWSFCANGDRIVNTVTVSAKCCDHTLTDSDSHTMKVYDPCDLRLTMESDHPNGANPGDVITYTLRVQNAGSSILSSVMVVDERLGICDIIECLKPCEWKNYTRTYTVSPDWTYCRDKDMLSNSASASAWCCCPTSGRMNEVCKHAMVTIPINCDASIRVDKELNTVNGRAYTGQEINTGDLLNWSITIRNTGKLALSEIIVNDTLLRCNGDVVYLMDNKQVTCCLESCKQITVYVEYKAPVCCSDYMLTNIATATACAKLEKVTHSDQNVVMVEGDCELTVTKTAKYKELFSGETQEWTITVQNTGKKDLSCVTVTDDKFPGWKWTIGILLKNSEPVSITLKDWNNTIECTGSPVIITNTAFATAKCCPADSEQPCCDVKAMDSARFLLKPQAAIAVDVKINERSCCKPGGMVYYDVTVTNVGNKTIRGFYLNDTLDLSNVYYPEDPYTLLSGKSVTVQFSTMIPKEWTYCDNGAYLNNTFTAWSCVSCPGGCLKVQDSDKAVWEVCSPCLLIDKEAFVDGKPVTEVWPGQVVMYKVTVRNAGAHAITCIKVMDPMFDEYWYIDCLASCTSQSFYFNITVPEWFCWYGDYLKNMVFAEGWCNLAGCCGDNVITADCDDCSAEVALDVASVPNGDGCPSCKPMKVKACDKESLFVHNEFHLVVYKDANVEKCVMPGQTIEYTIMVWNVGTCAITNVEIDDPILKFHATIQCLLPVCKDPKGQFMVKLPYTVDPAWSAYEDGNVIINTVTVKGYQGCNETVVTATEDVYVFDPCDVRITITAPETVSCGESIPYVVEVRNHGMNTAYNIHVYDPVLRIDEMIWCLEPAEAVTFTRTLPAPVCSDQIHYIDNTVTLWGCCCNSGMCHGSCGGTNVFGQMPDELKPMVCCHVDASASWRVTFVSSCC